MAAADGRDTRWGQHRTVRRAELIEETVRAVRLQGSEVGLDEIAAQAGTSKTVLYRHFGDRAGLNAAVVDRVHDYIHQALEVSFDATDTGDVVRLAHEAAEVYLSFVERDPEIYRFVVDAPTGEVSADTGCHGGLPGIMGDHIGQALARHLAGNGQDASCAATWGHGLVGFTHAVADRWLAGGFVEPREQILGYIDAFAAAGLVAGLAAVPQLQEQR
jgi:AcrR family transcriptional regulator